MQLNGKDTLVYESFPQAMWNRVPDAKIDDASMSIGALRYCNFYRPARLNALRLPYGPHKQPQSIRLSTWSKEGGWTVVEELEFAHQAGSGSHEVDLKGLETRHLLFECRRHHPEPQSWHEQWGSPYNPPYSILDGLTFSGEFLSDPYAPGPDELPVGDRLRRVIVDPRAPEGMSVKLGGNQVRFFGERFSVGFSLQRPMITHMGWDAIGAKAGDNLIRNRVDMLHASYPAHSASLSGPHWRTLPWAAFSAVWGGEIAVEENTVRYSNLNVNGEVTVSALFTISTEGMRLELTQKTNSARPSLELAAWRFVWNAQASAVASLAMPVCSGRTGAASLPLVWSAPGYGCLSCAPVETDGPVRVQVDSYRGAHTTFADLILGRDEPYPVGTFVPGTTKASATFEFRLEAILPELKVGVVPSDLHPALLREWGSGFMFRPELAGYSNNALSTNCHLSQAGVTDLAAHSSRPERGPHPIELARHTITMALKDGRGYGDSRDVYTDSDPVLLASAGRIHMTAPDAAWLKEVWPWLRRVALRHLGKCAENGLVAAPIPSGNRNAFPFSPANAWDTINGGHFDGYSNAETYRAWKNVGALAEEVGDAELRELMQEAAAKLRLNYEKVLWSEANGWLGTWRSRDGELHDYGLLVQNAAACMYGLVDEERARGIVGRIEAERARLGLDDAGYGFPSSLIAIPRYDQMPFAGGTAYRFDATDAFGIYCNGTLTMGLANFYMWALSRFGPKAAADRACAEILDAHLNLDVVGGEGTGCEFHSHEGAACGYEGAYVLQFPVLLAAAQHRGWVAEASPRFWPAVGGG